MAEKASKAAADRKRRTSKELIDAMKNVGGLNFEIEADKLVDGNADLPACSQTFSGKGTSVSLLHQHLLGMLKLKTINFVDR